MHNYYVVPRNILIGLLADQMELRAVEENGMDNWDGYGVNFDEVKQRYIKDINLDNIPDYPTWESVAAARIEKGEFLPY